jgi:hypothetical protein
VSGLARKLQLKEPSIRVVNRPPGVAPDLPVADDAIRPVRQVSIDEVWSALRFGPA